MKPSGDFCDSSYIAARQVNLVSFSSGVGTSGCSADAPPLHGIYQTISDDALLWPIMAPNYTARVSSAAHCLFVKSEATHYDECPFLCGDCNAALLQVIVVNNLCGEWQTAMTHK